MCQLKNQRLSEINKQDQLTCVYKKKKNPIIFTQLDKETRKKS
jgi:hypothetical protein